MRKSKVQLYAPFIALVLAQAAFVVWAPSDGEVNDPLSNIQVSSGQPAYSADGNPVAVSGATVAGGLDLDSSGNPITGGGVTGNPSPGDSGQDPTGPAPTIGGEGPTDTNPKIDEPTARASDTSHCTPEGSQTDLITTGPDCKPKFVGDNGGATYPGVTGDSVKFIRFACQSNAQVDAILQTQGLSATKEETDDMIAAVMKWMEETYEFYGRKLVYEHIVGDCPSSPYDPAKSRQAASEVAAKQPFIVYGGDPAAQDVFAQAGIISLAGPWQTNEFFAGRRPFRYDIFPNGTESADWLAEYYCKKMAGGNADHAGQVIHASIGTRSTTRKVGLLGFDNGDGTTVPFVERARDQLEQCAGHKVPIIYYESDISRATEQTRVVVGKLIEEKITTVVCLCDPIAPSFLTAGMSQNNYYPEHLMSGMYLVDYDVLGRLYDPSQWVHAFGPSHLADQAVFAESNAAKIWRASGREGTPCAACNLVTGYMTMMGSMLHYGGPNLNPLTVEQGLVGDSVANGGWAATKNPYDYLIKFGPNDYNAISDFREVYWSATARSNIDGKNGAYVSMNGGRRYTAGELDKSFSIPVAPQ
jgi:hypothetical protein